MNFRLTKSQIKGKDEEFSLELIATDGFEEAAFSAIFSSEVGVDVISRNGKGDVVLKRKKEKEEEV